MLKDRWLKIGLIGTIVAAVCCFTPLAVLALGAIGLGAYTMWLDPVVFPALIVFCGIAIASIIRLAQVKA